MSFDAYVDHISQKYRLAVAISVIKTKPNNVSMEEYLLQLQNKIVDSEFDPNETVCSDDFNFNDDEITYEKTQQNTCIEKSKSDKLLNESRQDYSVNDNDSQCSQTILNDFVFGDGRENNIESDACRESTIGDTIKLLKEVAANIHEKPDANQNSSQTTYCESQEANTNNDITYCNTNNINHIQNDNVNSDQMDSQETELYTLHGFTQNYTHVSQTQGDYIVLSEKYIRGNVSNVPDNTKYMNVHNGADMPMLHNASQNLFTQYDFATNADRNNVENTNAGKNSVNDAYNANIENAQSYQFLCKNVTPISVNELNVTKNNTDKTIGIASQEAFHVNAMDDTQRFQFNIQFANREFKGNSFSTGTKANNDKSKEIISENKTENIKDLNRELVNSTPQIFDSQKAMLHNETLDNNTKFNDLYNDSNLNSKANEYIDEGTTGTGYTEQKLSKGIIHEETEEMDVEESDSDINLQERVPFKVLEELNRVKMYLTRKDRERRNNDGYSTDSGYKSDSQSRCSLKSVSQACGTWLNQSAYCLFNYLVQTTGTDDIDKEIAQVLGQLIDKLHEDENYPQFLEEMLETIDVAVSDIHEGACAEVLITKDENIQRLLLLNKSKHILKHTIEKITTMLEKLHERLTQETLYELTNIVEVENTCYTFHMLEICLKRYIKVKDTSQSTQNSQEDFPKRSSLTELWRKKWNPNCKEIVKNDNRTCVLKRCREILNKIIVECMDGYSLVAFAALQCFNLIQV